MIVTPYGMRHSHPVLATRLMPERKQLRHNVRDVLPGLHPIAVRAAELPRDHGDPFDRVLIAHAFHDDLAVLTRDAMFPRYGVRVAG